MGTTKSLTTGYTNFGIPRSGLNLKFRLKGLEKILLLVLKDKLEQKNIATQETGCSEEVQKNYFLSHYLTIQHKFSWKRSSLDSNVPDIFSKNLTNLNFSRVQLLKHILHIFYIPYSCSEVKN